ncbi:hypothetical protein BV25DRAFT_1792230 [Artomyces pyxidatus]|uniref:Uncharacterized protein n=1 Tax=Artomyces pyxidatus TaxID=48021 RepID=A0ACB8TKG3_9AGAM|nr:hypothetical protein BV25DRAFT_1792230 [Artomyces pyxidatus]
MSSIPRHYSHSNSFLSIAGTASSTSIPATPPAPQRPHPPTPALSFQSSVHSHQTPGAASLLPSPYNTRRLLMPTVRAPAPPSIPKSPKIKPTTSTARREHDVGAEWFGKAGVRFEVVQEQLEIEGYQIYAVEKWCVAVTERTRPVTTLAVYTGDAAHKITVTALSPWAHLAPTEAQIEWDRVLRDLRQAGARPRETEQGTLMVTSLANFRSDYTIVHIPSGFFLEARERLYTNINLLRMGCSGRMALTLEEPGDTTKDRFIGMYRMDDKIRAPEMFGTTILELVKLIQAALAIFGMFELAPEERNGLLCDATVDGIQRWVTEIGEPAMGVEPSERVADPVVVCALLSQVSAVRNKLHALGFGQFIPKDPFMDPQRFLVAVQNFHASRLFAPASPPTSSPPPFLTDDTLDALDAAYDKSRATEPYKVHRVLLNKLDDSHVTEATADVAAFIRFVEARAAKEGVPSLRWLWTGRKREKERVWSDGEEEGPGREKDRDRTGVEAGPGEDLLTGEDGEYKVFGGRGKRVQKKIESWTGLNRGKKHSADFSHGEHHHHRHLHKHHRRYESQGQTIVPQVVVSREPAEEEEILSSGQVSPISPAETHNLLGAALPTAQSSTANLSDYDRRVSEFNHRRPWKPTQFRVTSWSDPRSAKDEDGLTGSTSSIAGRLGSAPGHAREETIKVEDVMAHRRRRQRYGYGLERRRSFDDADSLRKMRVLPIERMKIDVDLCGQLLIMRRREAHLAGVVSTLHVLTSRLSATNARLREDYHAHQAALGDAEARAKVIAEVDAARATADAMLQETRALSYEAAQFTVPHLWHGVAPQRQKVLALRAKVFDAGRRAPGAHGRFSHVQWMLDGRERLVDRTGRTPEEVEEEMGLPEGAIEEEEEDVVVREAMKPSWLLKMLESWGTRWGAGRKKSSAGMAPPREAKSPEPEGKRSMESVASADGSDARAASPTFHSAEGSDEG